MKKKLLPFLLSTCLSAALCLAGEEHIVEFCNAPGEKTVYRHSPNGALYAVENYAKNQKDEYELQTRESFYWEENNDHTTLRVQASLSENNLGDVKECSTFNYDDDGYLKSELKSDYEKGELRENTLYTYTSEGCLENCTNEKFSSSTLWDTFSSLTNWFSSSVGTVTDSLNVLKERLSYSNYIQKDVDSFLEALFGKGLLQFSGYYKQEHSSGVFSGGNTKANGKVRVTMINGILSLHDDLKASMAHVSQSHGNSDIHYIFRATEGWTKDVLNGTLIKCGYTSIQARMLAKMWIDLIQDLGGPQNGGIIIHYAHSVGALDTYQAQFLLTAEQRRMIHVVTIGSPAIIPNEGFASVVNYASRRDGVCLLDAVRFLGGLLHDDHNIIYLDTFWGIPLIDHPLSVESYQRLMHELGENFLEKYLAEITDLVIPAEF